MPNAGEVIRASDVTAQRCRVTRTAVQSITDATFTTVAFDDERFDNDTMHDTATNNTRITIKTAGVYMVGFHGLFEAANDYVQAYAVLLLNGTTEIAHGPSASTSTAVRANVAVGTVHQFSVNDYIEVRILQNNTANVARNLEATDDRSPEFYAARLGA